MSGGADRQREILPIPDRPYPGTVVYDAKNPDATFPPIAPVRPPEGAPNVLIILLDDVGFGASSAFGGPCEGGQDSHDHLLDPGQIFHYAMAKQ